MSTAVLPTTDADFQRDVETSPQPVLVEFTASWCPPCRALAPVLEPVANDRADRLRVRSLDIDTNPVTQARFGVMSVPTMVLFAGGEERLRLVGYMPRERLLEALDSKLATATA